MQLSALLHVAPMLDHLINVAHMNHRSHYSGKSPYRNSASEQINRYMSWHGVGTDGGTDL
jgi:hypothetical protein